MDKINLEKIKLLACEIAVPLGINIVQINYLREGKNNILRVIINKDIPVIIKDCEDISRPLSKALDKLNIIKENYYLEVSSRGIEQLNN
ncbi:MAG: hypothetical protein HYU63_07530 [Armatimonadetes bacterium]|nr:hypothetical protein [Armatimonadota bacterium]